MGMPPERAGIESLRPTFQQKAAPNRQCNDREQRSTKKKRGEKPVERKELYDLLFHYRSVAYGAILVSTCQNGSAHTLTVSNVYHSDLQTYRRS